MPQQAWSAKRERQYEHIKEGLRERGTSEDKAEEIAARTVNKERARSGEARESSRLSRDRHLLEPPRRPSLRYAPREGAYPRPVVRGGQGPGHPEPLEDEQGAAPARRRRQEASRRPDGYPRNVNPRTLDHVALWVADRHRMAEVAVERLGVRVIEQTDRFTLLGADARRGKLTLFDAEGPRERGPLARIGLRVSSLDGRDATVDLGRGPRDRAGRSRHRLGARPRPRRARLDGSGRGGRRSGRRSASRRPATAGWRSAARSSS